MKKKPTEDKPKRKESNPKYKEDKPYDPDWAKGIRHGRENRIPHKTRTHMYQKYQETFRARRIK